MKNFFLFSGALLLSFQAGLASAGDLDAGRALIGEKYFLNGDVLHADATEIQLQSALSARVDFVGALDAAMRIFLTGIQDDECPLSVILSSVGDPIPGVDPVGDLPAVRRYDRALGALLSDMSHRDASLRLLSLNEAPEGYEIGYVRDHWVFELRLPDDDHGYWAVIDRQGVRPAFCFGFN